MKLVPTSPAVAGSPLETGIQLVLHRILGPFADAKSDAAGHFRAQTFIHCLDIRKGRQLTHTVDGNAQKRFLAGHGSSKVYKEHCVVRWLLRYAAFGQQVAAVAVCHAVVISGLSLQEVIALLAGCRLNSFILIQGDRLAQVAGGVQHVAVGVAQLVFSPHVGVGVIPEGGHGVDVRRILPRRDDRQEGRVIPLDAEHWQRGSIGVRCGEHARRRGILAVDGSPVFLHIALAVVDMHQRTLAVRHEYIALVRFRRAAEIG